MVALAGRGDLNWLLTVAGQIQPGIWPCVSLAFDLDLARWSWTDKAGADPYRLALKDRGACGRDLRFDSSLRLLAGLAPINLRQWAAL